MKKFQGILVFIAFYVFSQVAAAEKVDALQWLSEQDSEDGSISLSADISNSDQSTPEAILALNELDGVDVQAKLATATTYLSGGDIVQKSTEKLSRIVLVKSLRDQNYDDELTELLKRRNSRGGFADFPKKAPNVLSTAFALKALSQTNFPTDKDSIGFLIDAQQGDGAWVFPAKGSSNVKLTAYSIDALWRYRHQFSVSATLGQAQSYLLSQKQASNQLWEDTEASALVLNSLALKLADRSLLDDSLGKLTSQQLSNGSFGNDVYLTALIAQLLQTLEKPSLDAIELTARVLDADTGVALTNAVATLEGQDTVTTTTDLNGEFVISPSVAGQYTLTISQEGYSEVVLQTTLVIGNQLSIGDIALNKLVIDPETGEFVVTGTIRGVIKSRLTNAPLQGVLVAVDGQPDLTALSDGDGEFQISNVPAGGIVVNASLAGYQIATGAAELLERQTLMFSPLLDKSPIISVSVFGVIIDNESGQALQGVDVVVVQNGAQYSAISDVDGSYTITGIPQGLVDVSASLAGYLSATGSVDAPAGANISFSPAMVLEGNPPADLKALLNGIVIDSATGRGLSNVRIAITYDVSGQTLTFYTDEDGNISVDELDTGAVSLEFSLAGYRAVTSTAELQPGLGIDFGVIELEADVPQVTADISGRVVNLRTNQVVANSFVKISRNGTLLRETMTDTTGAFTANMVDLGDVTIAVSKQGFTGTEFIATIDNVGDIDLGDIRLRPEGVEQLLADLAILSIDTTAAVSNGQTLELQGEVAIEIANRGNANAVAGFKVLAFDDVNNDGAFDSGDLMLGEENYDQPIAVDDVVIVNVEVSGAQRFRDAPVSVFVDASNFVAELSEANNIDQSKGECSRQTGVKVDLALCLDSSGSVSYSEFNLQLEGTARALENPEIVARDGSVRATVIQFSHYSQVELLPTAITESNIQSVVDEIRTIRKRGGGTSIHSCIDAARSRIVTANQTSPSLSQVIDVSTDGRSSFNSAVVASNRAQNAGIDVLNSIGVGSGVDTNLLNNIVFPQPVGGERGFVVTTRNFQEYIDAISVKIAKETKLVDLTAGQLAITTSEDLASLSVVVGNSGSGDISETIIVRFYNSDPAQGGVEIGSVEYDAGIVSGGHLTLSIDGLLAGQLNSGAVYAVAEFVDPITECTTANNQTSADVFSDAGEIDLTLDKQQYRVDETLQFTSAVINTGLFPGTYRVDTIIFDAAGNEVIRFDGQASGEIAANAQIDLDGSWAVGQSLAGNYTATSLLYNSVGELIDQDQEAFVIIADAVVTLRTTTDRAQYHANDSVEIDDLIRNVSLNSLERDTDLRVIVNAPNGTETFNVTKDVGDLTPNFSNSYIDVLQLNDASLGEYQVTGVVLSASGTVLATATSTFSVINNLALALSGSVEASVSELYQGESLSCVDTINNTGALDITDLQLRQLTANMDDGSLISSNEVLYDLAAGTTLTLDHAINTTGFELGNYSCAVQAFINGEWENLDADFFEVLEPPISIDLTATTGSKGRVLILLDDSTLCTEEPAGPRSAPDLLTQQQFLESLLDEAGWSYTITLNANDFITELRTGGYSTYLLLAEITNLPHFVQKEVREAVYRGEGLVEASKRLDPQQPVNDALGSTQRGKENHATGISVLDDRLHPTGDVLFGFDDKNIRIRPNSSTSVAEYLASQHESEREYHRGSHRHGSRHYSRYSYSHCPQYETQPSSSITFNEFGLGKSAYFGFDLLLEATNAGLEPNAFADLLLNALNQVNPTPPLTTVGTDYPVIFTVTNLGTQTPARLVLSVPETVSAVDVGEGVIDQFNSTVTWDVELAEDAVLSIPIWVEMPDSATPLTAIIEASVGGDYQEVATVTVELMPEQGVTFVDVIDSVQSVRSLRKVRKKIKKAQRLVNKGRHSKALTELLLASNYIAQIQRYYNNDSLLALRVNVDLLIKQIATMVVVKTPRNRCKVRGVWGGYHYPIRHKQCRGKSHDNQHGHSHGGGHGSY